MRGEKFYVELGELSERKGGCFALVSVGSVMWVLIFIGMYKVLASVGVCAQ